MHMTSLAPLQICSHHNSSAGNRQFHRDLHAPTWPPHNAGGTHMIQYCHHTIQGILLLYYNTHSCHASSERKNTVKYTNIWGKLFLVEAFPSNTSKVTKKTPQRRQSVKELTNTSSAGAHEVINVCRLVIKKLGVV